MLRSCVLIIAIAAAGPLYGALPASVSPQQPAPSAAKDRPAPLALEFELPAEYNMRAPDGQYVLRAVRVGFFGSADGKLLRTTEIRRDAIEVVGGRARVRVELPAVPEGSSLAIVRLQNVTTERLSDWSESAGTVTLPELPAPPVPPSKMPVTPASLEKFPALKAELEPLVGPDCRLEDLSAFRTIEELATVVVLARRQVVKFADMCKNAKQAPKRSLTSILRRVDPSVKRGPVIRAAQPQVRQLLRPAK